MASLKAFLTLNGEAFQRGLTAAKSAAMSFGRGMGSALAGAGTGLKTLTRSWSLFGKALAVGGFYGAIRGIADAMEKARANSDFTFISEKELRKLENAKSNIELMRDAMMGVLARGASNLISRFTGTKDSGASLAEIAKDQADTETMRGQRRAIRRGRAGDDPGAMLAAIEYDMALLEKKRTKTRIEANQKEIDMLELQNEHAQVLEKLIKAEDEESDAVEKAVKAVKEKADADKAAAKATVERIRDEQAQDRATKKAEVDSTVDRIRNDQESDRSILRQAQDSRLKSLQTRADRLASFALGPTEDNELQRLANRGGRKMLRGQKLTAREQAAVESVSATREIQQTDITNDLLRGIKANTDNLKLGMK